jgi:hypothetical protein
MLGAVFYVLCLVALRNGDLRLSLEIPEICVYCIVSGLALGAVVGVMIAPFYRDVTRVLRVTDREAFLSCLHIAIGQMPFYEPGTQTAQFLTFRRRPRWTETCVGPIFVQVELERATIVGPKTHVAELLKLLKRLNAPCGART